MVTILLISSRSIVLPLNLLPTPDAFATIYEQIYNGQLTEPSVYGTDRLEENKPLQDLRCSNFLANYKSSQFLQILSIVT